MFKNITLVALLCSLAACTTTPVLTDDAPTVYLNTNIGFSNEAAAYDLNQFVCDIDDKLIEQITKKSASHNIRVIPVDTAIEMEDKENLLAIDISELMKPQSSSHQGGSTSAASLGIEAVFIHTFNGKKSFTKHQDHCSATLTYSQAPSGRSGYSGQTSGASMGSVKGSLCSGMRKCAKSLSGDLSDWLLLQVK